MGKPRIDLTGHQSGHLLVTADTGERRKNNAVVECNCLNCGKAGVKVFKNGIRGGSSTHCGCLSYQNRVEARTTHGCSHTPLYHCWLWLRRAGMLCPQWLDFETMADAVGYLADHTVGPIDKNKPIGPDNYKLHPPGESSRGIMLEINGEVRTISAWSKKIGVSRQYGHQLFKLGRLEARIKKDYFNEQ